MYEDPESKKIFYQDQTKNFYRPIPPPDLSEEEAKGWFPFVSRMNPSNYQALFISRTPRANTPKKMPYPSEIVGLNGPQALKPTLSHPPGFDPKMLPQTIKQGDHTRCTRYPGEGTKAETTRSLKSGAGQVQ
ncbi:hypothetical protein GOP47_0006632 [Adiantum capillus-veneris]|uniref:Uncharacterized protein n=1 Tax=Adiantum capillus-veneris TaxID=13818 RepID=A0A9D4V392_ADICA|nr:hypothetical protein GOP47_0006632 [Adiantum capillus-veneris]